MRKKKNRKILNDNFFILNTDDNNNEYCYSIKKYENNYLLKISVLDIIPFIKNNSFIEKNAKKICFSYYLDKKYNIFHDKILNLLKFKKGYKKLTITIEILIDSNGFILNSNIYKSISILNNIYENNDLNNLNLNNSNNNLNNLNLNNSNNNLINIINLSKILINNTEIYNQKNLLLILNKNKKYICRINTILKYYTNKIYSNYINKKNIKAIYINNDKPNINEINKIYKYINNIILYKISYYNDENISIKKLLNNIENLSLKKNIYDNIIDNIDNILNKNYYSDLKLTNFIYNITCYTNIMNPLNDYSCIYQHILFNNDSNNINLSEICNYLNEKKKDNKTCLEMYNYIYNFKKFEENIIYNANIIEIHKVGIKFKIDNEIIKNFISFIHISLLGKDRYTYSNNTLYDSSRNARFKVGETINIKILKYNMIYREIEWNIC